MPSDHRPEHTERPPAQIHPQILNILRCPVTGSPLRQEGDALIAVEDPQRRYPIRHGVPTLLAAPAP
ncbi:Trm112 family protein [Nesterenkonia sp.]|uniref:Trm112 family protein n=1 Tax=Nesterenkonia sp. TaxID=704201 RepID=UPI00262D7471|nr:Trm112 family protein [Nesterenkonia sp.]